MTITDHSSQPFSAAAVVAARVAEMSDLSIQRVRKWDTFRIWSSN